MPLDLSQLLQQARGGDPLAVEKLFPIVYDELRRRAEVFLRRERADHTLQATALVNEAFVRMVGGDEQAWESNSHFFNAASLAMRRILVDHARARKAAKRGGSAAREPLDSTIAAPEEPESEALDIMSLDAALDRLAGVSERAARLVELRYFCGLTEPQAAKVLGVSLRTAAADWAFARAWLRRELSGSTDGAEPRSPE